MWQAPRSVILIRGYFVTGRFKTSHLWSIQNQPLVGRDFMVIL